MGIKKLLVAAMSAGVIMSVWSIASLADTGWVKKDNGEWYYYVSETEYLKDCWKSDGGNWYYLYEDGTMLKDVWAYIDGKMYYFGSSGAMQKNQWIECGEANISGTYYGIKKIIENPEYEGVKNYRYVGSDGAALTGWQKINGSWYYFENEEDVYGDFIYQYGFMKYGALYDYTISDYVYIFDEDGKMISDTWYEGPDGNWWYLGSDGAAYIGWHKIDGNWYYFRRWGDYTNAIEKSCVAFTYGDDYYGGYCMFDDNGHVMGKGWHQFADEWYYADSSGYLYQNKWLDLNGVKYYFDSECKLVTDKKDFFAEGYLFNFNSSGACTNYSSAKKVNGWYQLKGREIPYYIDDDQEFWVYVKPNGALCYNEWRQVNGAWYYFDYEHRMVTGCYTVGTKRYEFDANGKCVDPYPDHRGWYREEADNFSGEYWFYFDGDGDITTGWKNIGGKWYYFDEQGQMAQDTTWYMDEGTYYFDEDGVMQTGWFKRGTYDWGYAESDGQLFENGWKQINGKWYYFSSGTLYGTNYTLIINDKLYDFDSNGACTNPDNPHRMKVYLFSYD